MASNHEVSVFTNNEMPANLNYTMHTIDFGKFQILDKSIKLDDLRFENDTCVILINFGTDNSIKIIPFFESIKKKEVKSLLEIFKNTGVDLRLYDSLGMLHIVLLKILTNSTEKQVLILTDTGFTQDSIIFLQVNFSKLLSTGFENKSIVVYSENLPHTVFKNFFTENGNP